MFLHENNHNYNSYKFSYKLAFILFLSFLSNQKQESGLQQVGGLVKRNVSVFVVVVVVVYNKLCSTSKPYQTQQTFIKEFFYMLFLFALQFHAPTMQMWCCNSTEDMLKWNLILTAHSCYHAHTKANITHYIS